MSEQQPNPYAGDPNQVGGQGDNKWGPGTPSYGAPAQPGYGYPSAGPPQPGYGYPPADPSQPGYGYPQPPAYQPTIGGAGMTAPMPPMPSAGYAAAGLSLGDITIAGDQIITPSGNMPLRGAIWNATDFSRTEEKIPAHAIVLAVIFFLFCLLGLLFLLMKERRTTGYIQITVNSGGRHHSTMIPAVDPGTYMWVMSQLNQARALSM
ncbi:hypothetical protein [Streptomyces sp. NBC_00503]|uniref:hypothetical protein n=1 Tax=Streptomyces sp. NBC_00503 TaxID=2903659 RepID=UPI002E81CA60|nr:hypothetical protein [Streptomyces sp. NBC_00503]WUD83206.1 hypothetical protein OG490_23065 [Streptomyces sp. NBC_00503]